MLRRRFLGLSGQLGAGLSVGPLLQPAAGLSFGQSLNEERTSGSSAMVIPLDHGWSIATDPHNTGRAEAWFRGRQPGTEATRVPSIIQETFPGYHGVVWYWVDFQPAPHPYAAGRYLLRFHAVDYLAEVWLNSIYLGSHEGERRRSCLTRRMRCVLARTTFSRCVS